MSITLRQAIMMRVKGKSEAELREVIQDSIRSEERALPGLGVLFEIMWEESSEEQKDAFVALLKPITSTSTDSVPDAPVASATSSAEQEPVESQQH